jgi:hypothetical protein
MHCVFILNYIIRGFMIFLNQMNLTYIVFKNEYKRTGIIVKHLIGFG